MLTLADVFHKPAVVTKRFTAAGHALTFQPLTHEDEKPLATFIDSLSKETKRFSNFNQTGAAIAHEMCAAINRYDKLRFVITEKKSIIGLFEFSFDIPEGDIKRFHKYDISLLPTDCRLGPVLCDLYQGRGIGSALIPLMKDIAKKFGRKRIILWGGVHLDNLKAVRFYEKNEFKKVGEFVNSDGQGCWDMVLEM